MLLLAAPGACALSSAQRAPALTPAQHGPCSCSLHQQEQMRPLSAPILSSPNKVSQTDHLGQAGRVRGTSKEAISREDLMYRQHRQNRHCRKECSRVGCLEVVINEPIHCSLTQLRNLHLNGTLELLQVMAIQSEQCFLIFQKNSSRKPPSSKQQDSRSVQTVSQTAAKGVGRFLPPKAVRKRMRQEAVLLETPQVSV